MNAVLPTTKGSSIPSGSMSGSITNDVTASALSFPAPLLPVFQGPGSKSVPHEFALHFQYRRWRKTGWNRTTRRVWLLPFGGFVYWNCGT
jgi:hypothetical protein